MLNWIFGKKKQQINEKDPNFWMYECLQQYLSSPLWRIPIIQYFDKYCYVFEDKEQNKFEYTKIFNDFKKMIETNLTNTMDQIGITIQIFQKCIRKGLNSQKKRVFQQLLICDNFCAFKKTMIKRNKQLQIESIKQLQNNSTSNQSDPQAALRYQKQLQKMNIDQAIAFAKAIEEKLSKIEGRQPRSNETIQKQIIKKNSKILQEEKPKFNKLPPLMVNNKYQKSLEQLEKNKLKIDQQLKQINIKQENMEDRKKRLMEQREKIRKKKEQQRKNELISYSQKEKVTEEEIERRKKLMNKLRENIQDF